MAKNCHTCSLAKDQGATIACRFDFETVLQGWPMAPICKVKVMNTAIRKEKIPDEDCMAWKSADIAEGTVPDTGMEAPIIVTRPGADLEYIVPMGGAPLNFTVKSPNHEEYKRALDVCGYPRPPLWRPGTLLHYRGIVRSVQIEFPK